MANTHEERVDKADYNQATLKYHSGGSEPAVPGLAESARGELTYSKTNYGILGRKQPPGKP